MIYLKYRLYSDVFYTKLDGDSYTLKNVYIGRETQDLVKTNNSKETMNASFINEKYYKQYIHFDIVTDKNDTAKIDLQLESVDRNVFFDKKHLSSLYEFYFISNNENILLDNNETSAKELIQWIESKMEINDDIISKLKYAEQKKIKIKEDFQ